MNSGALLKSTKFVISALVIAGLLRAPQFAQADNFDRLLRNAAIDNGFSPPQETHVSVDKRLVAIGRRFFESKNLSLNGNIACRDCHLDEFGSADGIPLAVGVRGDSTGRERAMSEGAIIPRNTLPLWGRGGDGFDVFLWDGRVDFSGGKNLSPFGATPPSDDPLVIQIHLPAVEIREMLVEDKIVSENKLETVDSAQKVYQAIVDQLLVAEQKTMSDLAEHLGVQDSGISFVDVALSIAHFIRDRFRVQATAFHHYVFGAGVLSEPAKNGGLIFFGKGKCATCHSGPYFSDFKFHGIAFLQLGFGKNGFGVDYGRFNATHDPSDLYRFRTPPLLNVTLTAPYGHSGSLATLSEAITAHFDPLKLVDPGKMSPLDRHEFYKQMVVASENIIQMGYLDADEIDDLVEFLQTLTY